MDLQRRYPVCLTKYTILSFICYRAICLHVATIGYATAPEFALHAPNEWDLPERIAYALRNVPILVDAVKKERAERDAAKAARGRRQRASPRSKL